MSDTTHVKDTVCAVMVLYRPPDQIESTIRRVLSQVEHLILVNNGVSNEVKSRLSHPFDSVSWLDNTENNLAKAHNMGIHHARTHDYAFVLLLDEDSEPADDMVQQQLNAYHAAHQEDSDQPAVGLIAPMMQDINTHQPTRYITPFWGVGFRQATADQSGYLRHVIHVIASGSLIPLHVIAQVGQMDESYVIDYIDKEFCLRLRIRGFETRVATQATMRHRIGEREDHTLLGLPISTTNHSPARRYTIYRNRLRTMGRYGLVIPSFALHELMGVMYDLLRITLFEEQKKDKLSAILRGIKDAALGVFNPPTSESEH